MPTKLRASLDEIRGFFARMMAAASGSNDPRLERVFELIPREAFLPPGPWKIGVPGRRQHVETPSSDPVYVYLNAVVALDPAKGINNGEPLLHAAWIGAVAPQPGESICHIGTGGGYYTAVLSMLALPGGTVTAFEIDDRLARMARDNLTPFDNVSVIPGDATKLPLPASDVIYVNAGVVTPPVPWLKALRPGGRLIFPWRPSDQVALAVVISRCPAGFRVEPLMPAFFIACVGASDADACLKAPNRREAWSARSLWLSAEHEPDETAVAICPDVWMSSADLPT